MIKVLRFRVRFSLHLGFGFNYGSRVLVFKSLDVGFKVQGLGVEFNVADVGFWINVRSRGLISGLWV